MAKLILLGRIGAAHGLKGELVVQSFTAEPLDLKAYGPLSDETGRRQFHILSLRVAGKGLIVRVKGIDDRTAAEALRGTELYVPREKLPAANGDDFYLADLIGLAVIATDGSAIGEVIDVPNYGAGDLLEIKPEAGGETLLVPFTRDFVPSVDIAGGTILVVPPVLTETGDEDTPDSEEE